MCGACGAGSARTRQLHWSSPFLASTQARSAAARTLTLWARLAGWAGSVTGVAGGYQVATASGRRRLASDLGAVVEHLEGGGIPRRTLLTAAAAGIVEGPPTCPMPFPGRPVPGRGPDGAAVVVELPPDPRRPYRVPALMAWLAAAETTGRLDGVSVEVGIDAGQAIRVLAHNDRVGSCHLVLASDHELESPDVVTSRSGGALPELIALLG